MVAMKTRTLIRSVLLLAPIALSTLGSTAPAQDTGSESAEKAAGARDDRAGMVRIAGGSTRLGAGDERRDVDALEVELAPFWIDAREVTNADFARFVEATGFSTDAERIGNSVVFVPGAVDPSTGIAAPGGWDLIEGADWRRPYGAGSSIEGLGDHPVVHVSIHDARAFAAWAGKRLPTEAEWEHAARGGLVDQPYAWGDTAPDDADPWVANTWQGRFPLANRRLDGYLTTAPVATFAPNGYGLFDVSGNVWEWVDTPRGAGELAELHGAPGPLDEPGAVHQIRGGSFLCAANYCQGYRVTERQFKYAEDGCSNLGFRCAAD